MDLALVVALLLANGFFVATEFAIVAVRASRLDQLIAEGKSSAQAARHVVERLDIFIAACQLGITMASLALGWIGEPAVARVVEPAFTALLGAYGDAASHGVAVGLAFALITALHIVIGELAPKGLALQRPEATALAVARPMQAFETVFRLPIRVLNNVGNGVLRLFGLDAATSHDLIHSVDELRVLVSGMQQAGVVDDVEARIAGRAFRLGEVTVGVLMTPRTEIDGVPLDASVEAAIDVALASGHSRLVVYDGSIDNIVGSVHLRELVAARRGTADGSVNAHVRPVPVTPESRPADVLLEELRAQRVQLAVVLDEYGSTAGIVTLENLFEALVGRVSENDAVSMQTETDGSLVMEGQVRLDELEELTAMRIEPTLRAEVDTVGGLVMAELGRVPAVGDEVSIAGRTLRVEAVQGRRIAALRVLPTEASAAS